MHIDYEILEEDFVIASKLGCRTVLRFYYARIWFFRGIGLILIACSVFLSIQSGDWISQLAIFIFGFFMVGCTLLSGYNARKQYRKMPSLHGLRSLDANADSLHFILPEADVKSAWSLYGKFAEDKHSFVLIQKGTRVFVPIPKRELSLEQITELRSLFETHLPAK